jgi:hypothetical protein
MDCKLDSEPLQRKSNLDITEPKAYFVRLCLL